MYGRKLIEGLLPMLRGLIGQTVVCRPDPLRSRDRCKVSVVVVVFIAAEVAT